MCYRTIFYFVQFQIHLYHQLFKENTFQVLYEMSLLEFFLHKTVLFA